MERIKNILQRLQEVYYGKHQKSAIDVDLMMDYTRVMYADLMEWRKQFKDPLTSETAEQNTTVITSEAEKEAAATPEQTSAAPETASPEAAEEQPEAPVAVASEQPEGNETADAEVVAVAPEQTEVNETANTEEETAAPADTEAIPDDAGTPEATPATEPGYLPIERDEPPAREPVEETEEPVTAIHPEQEQVESLKTDASGISFEPPAQHEVKSEIKDDVLVEEAPAVNQPVEEIPAPAPVEIPLPDIAPPKKAEAMKAPDLFQAAKVANRDIRGSIGINDKYLFLNELFNNHKSNYEETLDKLNHFSTLEQAEDWIKTKVVPVQKWDQDDATVHGFYAMLSKHFSAR